MIDDSGNKPTILPKFYYLDHFEEIIAHVCTYYYQILSEAEIEWVEKFKALEYQQKALLVRIINRNRIFLRLDDLKYDELTQTKENLQHLFAVRFIESAELKEESHLLVWLNYFNKAQLKQMFLLSNISALKKEMVIAHIIEQFDTEAIFEILTLEKEWFSLSNPEIIASIKFLFFGNHFQAQERFVVRDLGHVQYQDSKQYQTRYKTRTEFESAYFYSVVRSNFSGIIANIEPSNYLDFCNNFPPTFASSIADAERVIEKMALLAAKTADFELAICLYEKLVEMPVRDRIIKLHLKLKDTISAERKALEILEAPRSVAEALYANDWLNKHQGLTRQSSLRRLKLNAETIEISPRFGISVEQAAMEYYEDQGFTCFRTENEPWRLLFALTFWEIFQDPEFKHQPFDLAHKKWPEIRFASKATERLEQLKQELDEKNMLVWFEKRYQQFYPLANPICAWYGSTKLASWEIIKHLSVNQLFDILAEMSSQITQKLTGFPDLMLLKNAEIQLIEIKSPNDQVSSIQHHWIGFLNSIGVSTNLISVKWLN